MDISLKKVTIEEKDILWRLLQLYKYDFTEWDPEDVNEQGIYPYTYFEHYFIEEDRFPFLVQVAGQYAGFALIRRITEGARTYYAMAEFFIMKKYRRGGAGTAAAQALFAMFPGQWEVAEITENVPAQQFWRRVIGAYTNGAYEEGQKDGWDGPVQVFWSEG